VFTTGWIVAGAFLELRSQGSFLLDNLDFPSRVAFTVLDDSLQNYVLLPFSRSSRSCTLDFSKNVLSGGKEWKSYSSVIPWCIDNKVGI
jgi:hypothetical protein